LEQREKNENMDENKKNYFIVWEEALVLFDLKPSDASLLFLVCSLSKKRGYCYASRETLAKKLNVSVATIYNLLRKLKRRGLLTNAGTSNYYTVKIGLTDKMESFLEGTKNSYKKEID